MTVRELLTLIAPSERIFIKPSGNKTYFEGKASAAPESLMETKVLEIGARTRDDDDIALAVWVEHEETWDLMVEGIPDFQEFPDMADACYLQSTIDPVFFKQDTLNTIERKRKQRMVRYWNERKNPMSMPEIVQRWIEDQEKRNWLKEDRVDEAPSRMEIIPDDELVVDDGEPSAEAIETKVGEYLLEDQSSVGAEDFSDAMADLEDIITSLEGMKIDET